MGNYSIEVDELKHKLSDFLQGFDGEVHAENLAKAWNLLAERYDWDDRLKSYSGVEGD